MRQEYKYEVTDLGPKISTILEGNDQALVESYRLGTVSPFNPDESRLDAILYDLDGNVLETYQDISDYAIRGVEQGSTQVNQLEVNPAGFMEDRTFLGDIVVEYKAFDNVYSKGTELYIFDISTDRTEIRAKSITLSTQDLRYYTSLLQHKLNDESYFYGAFFEVDGNQIPITNVILEAIDSETVVTFKLYTPLPSYLQLKARFQVLESLGEAKQFRVHRELVVVEDEIPSLKGPNFGVEIGTSTIATDYKNYLELLSQKSWENSKELYTTFKDAIQHTSVDYEDFSDFIHFSSAFERLENARYKFEKIFDYQIDLIASESAGKTEDVKKIQDLISGIIANFDHYENYLWFESGSRAWPKRLDKQTGTVARPFIPVNHPEDVVLEDTDIVEPGYLRWYNEVINLAEGYDNNNKDILISTIPAAIREDLDNNEPYLIFIHMIGQHFDDLWIYARAITDRYSGDNRLEFGISKELVKDALEAFGIDIYETNQNLNAFFELCQPDGTYDWGEELAGKEFIRVSDDPSWIEQPLTVENYRKRVYKRIYHNVPALLKMRGTSRGLRVLLNCFGIPNDILTFKVQGGTDTTNRPFFGPEEMVNIYNEDVDETGLVGSPAGIKKIRTDNKNEPILEYRTESGSGIFYKSSTLSRYTSVTSSKTTLTDDSHKVEVGFDVNEAANQFFRKQLEDSDFTVDDVIGDPRNKEEQYGDPWKSLRERLLNGVDLPDNRFRSPAAIIRLVRYFDSAFFRMLKDFIPARASINSGAIIKDNILHRNRWKGVEVTWQELTKSGSISGSAIYGSHGGSFRHAGYKFDTTDKFNIVSTGDRWVDKGVLSGSREINGELAGSKIKVTDGDLSKYNTHRKDLQPANNFPYQMWFLDLPDPPFCSSKLSSIYQCEYWKFESVGKDVTGTLANVLDVEMPSGVVLHTFAKTGSENFSEVYDSQWVTPSLWSSSYTFMGWYKAGTTGNTGLSGSAITPARVVNLDPFIVGPNYYLQAYYATSSVKKILWMELLRPEQDNLYYFYPDNDLLVAWKLLNREDNPRTVGTEPTGSVISSLGGVKVRLKITNTKEGKDPEIQDIELPMDDTDIEITLPDEITFGTNNGYYWIQGFTHSGSISNYGMTELGNYIAPYRVGSDTIVDATWFDNYEDWVGAYDEAWTWPIAVGSQGEKIPVRDEEGYWRPSNVD